MSPMVRLPLSTELALLGFLRERPMYGYEIHQCLGEAEGLGLVWRMKQSQLYALLGKLEGEGLVRATIEPQESKPPRKVFHMTPAGEALFREWVASPVAHGRELRLDFLAKLYFARREGEPILRRLIERQRVVCLAWLEEAQARLAPAGPPTYEWLVHQFRVGQIQAMVAWLDTCEQTMMPHSLPSEGSVELPPTP